MVCSGGSMNAARWLRLTCRIMPCAIAMRFSKRCNPTSRTMRCAILSRNARRRSALNGHSRAPQLLIGSFQERKRTTLSLNRYRSARDGQQYMAQQTSTPRKMPSRSPSAPAWLRTTGHRVNRSTRRSPSDRAGLRPMGCLCASGCLPTSILPVNPQLNRNMTHSEAWIRDESCLISIEVKVCFWKSVTKT